MDDKLIERIAKKRNSKAEKLHNIEQSVITCGIEGVDSLTKREYELWSRYNSCLTDIELRKKILDNMDIKRDYDFNLEDLEAKLYDICLDINDFYNV